ncbi:MAG: nucleoside deaminase [Chloroflexota bacterium]|nr:MAG: nucleoside deaminase [Chloroflexota bacterium]
MNRQVRLWESLAIPWQASIQEAWLAHCHNTVPIGAAIAGPDGTILATGRNRILDGPGEGQSLYGHPLAHAEMNALVSMDYKSIDPHVCTLYTTMEPCPLCLGAFYMSGLRQIRFASRDPLAGSINLLGATEYLSRKVITVVEPEDPALEDILIAWHVEFNLEHDRDDRARRLHAVWSPVVPLGVLLGEKLFRNGELRRMRETGMPVEEALNMMEAERDAFSIGV